MHFFEVRYLIFWIIPRVHTQNWRWIYILSVFEKINFLHLLGLKLIWKPIFFPIYIPYILAGGMLAHKLVLKCLKKWKTRTREAHAHERVLQCNNIPFDTWIWKTSCQIGCVPLRVMWGRRFEFDGGTFYWVIFIISFVCTGGPASQIGRSSSLHVNRGGRAGLASPVLYDRWVPHLDMTCNVRVDMTRWQKS
jgi:hypothetical protein